MNLLLTASFFVGIFSIAPLLVVEPKIGQTYIVLFHQDTDFALIQEHIKTIHDPENILHVYKHSVKGYAAIMDDVSLSTVRQDPNVDFVETDSTVTTQQCSTQSPVPSWGLARTTNKNANFGTSMVYHDNPGQGIRVYVIDTGVLKISNDFSGRMGEGVSFIPGQHQDEDGNGHGTHCASTAAGTVYGLAKSATVFGVKVLSNAGSGSTSGVISGVDWTAAESKKYPGKCVANMSLGGGKSTASNNAADALMDADCFLAVAAGNCNADSCRYSPASAPKVMTVGATMNNNARSSFSNWGPECTDIFAPGSNIVAAYRPNAGSTATLSGTSMASPHVCGLGAVLRQQNPSWNSHQVKTNMLGMTANGQINLNCGGVCGQSPNKMAVVTCPL